MGVEEAHSSTMAPATETPAVTTTMAPTIAATTSTEAPPATTPDGACAGPWEQCGGNGWTGTTCCVSGYTCNELSEWHSQCDPVSGRRLRGASAATEDSPGAEY